VAKLKISNSGLDCLVATFWPFAFLFWISTPTLGTTWLDQLG